ncbi:MAG: sulfite exporter TauE/SafE family protein [Myxococcales bacterium]|nr:sulfite exporter TauE/SafE family protein [Myxococcales bacterium]
MNDLTALTLAGSLTLGLMGSGHCVAMCGGIVGALGVSPLVKLKLKRPHPLPRALAFHAGRLSAYALLGALAATLGGALPISQAPWILKAIGALSMVLVGLQLAGLSGLPRRLEALGRPLWSRVAPAAQRFIRGETPLHRFALGLLWALMPCGMIYAALAASLTAPTPSTGALTMLVFGLGTLPSMLTVSLFADVLRRRLATASWRRAAGALVLAIGLANAGALAWSLTHPPADRSPCGCPRNLNAAPTI